MASESELQVPAGAAGPLNPTLAAALSAWPLLAGMSLLMVGNGLAVTLLGVRATSEGFATLVTGIVMSGYFAGFFAGTWLTPRIIANVGHVRVFAALASIASVALLVHSLLVDPISWTAMRAVTGFSFAGLYIVAESWLNTGTGNRTRGRLMAVYMITQYIGLALGQALLGTADPNGFALFIVASIVVSAAVVPILLSANPAPAFETPTPMSPRQVFRASPLGALGAVTSGLTQGAFWSLGAVYVTAIQLSVGWVAIFMTSVTIGGVLLQWPVGHFSDVIGRRKVMVLVSVAGAAACLAGGALAGTSTLGLIAAACVFGGMTLPLYSLSVAQTNDYLEPAQMVAASSALVLLYGTGSIFGPLIASAAMEVFGPNGFFWYLAVVTGWLGLFTLYRMSVRAAKPLAEQTPYVPILARRSPLSAAVAEPTETERGASR
jgi:MFS family permease